MRRPGEDMEQVCLRGQTLNNPDNPFRHESPKPVQKHLRSAHGQEAVVKNCTRNLVVFPAARLRLTCCAYGCTPPETHTHILPTSAGAMGQWSNGERGERERMPTRLKPCPIALFRRPCAHAESTTAAKPHQRRRCFHLKQWSIP